MADQDFGAYLNSEAQLLVQDDRGYDLGLGDFSITMIIQTEQIGTLVYGYNDITQGFALQIEENNLISFSIFSRGSTTKVSATIDHIHDGAWHSIAIVHRNGDQEIWFNGVKLDVSKMVEPSSEKLANATAPIIFGCVFPGSGDAQWDYVGLMEDITLWKIAVDKKTIFNSMFNMLKGSEKGLIGLWALNENYDDDSPISKPLKACGDISFKPIFHCRWLHGDNGFVYARVETDHDDERLQALAQRYRGETVNRTQYVNVEEAVPYLLGVTNEVVTYVDYPKGVIVSVTSPSGKKYDTDITSDDICVVTHDKSVFQIGVKNPESGRWRIDIESPPDVSFQFIVQAYPKGEKVYEYMEKALEPLYPEYSEYNSSDSGPLPSGYSAGYFASAPLALMVLNATRGDSESKEFGLIPLVWVAAVAVVFIAVYVETYILAVESSEGSINTGPYDINEKGKGERTPAEVFNAIVNKVGDPATHDPSKFVTRQDMGIDYTYNLHVDVGGEGYHEIGEGSARIVSGFASALNLNAKEYDSQRSDVHIPLLIHLTDWDTDPPYPFADRTVNYFTMQGAPLTMHNVNEMERCLDVGGKIGIWFDHGDFENELAELARLLNTTPRWSDDAVDPCYDEFHGEFGTPKVLLDDHRQRT